jgi:hypothetical protein
MAGQQKRLPAENPVTDGVDTSLNQSADFPLAVSRKQAHHFSIENDFAPILRI